MKITFSFKQRAVFKLQGAPKSPEAFAERQIPVPLVQGAAED